MSNQSKQRILLVDDNELIREMAADVLSDKGYEVAQASDAAEALAHLRASQRFDLLLSDVRMPGMSGRELADVALDLWPELAVIIMTGYAEEALRKPNFLAEGMRLLRKPFSLADLMRTVEDALH
ncbi:MAG: response regulator [Pseudoxanthomonas sp.]|jgi:two-component system cell cycle response regulator CpdR